MRHDGSLGARLAFLVRVTQKESELLLQTDQRLFETPMTVEKVEALQEQPDTSERLEAFVARFSRLQDTLGDKLIPTLIIALGEPVGAAMENLDRAEQLGLVLSADSWLTMRRLRNQMVHEYIEDSAVLCDALNSGHLFVDELLATADKCCRRANLVLPRLPPGT